MRPFPPVAVAPTGSTRAWLKLPTRPAEAGFKHTFGLTPSRIKVDGTREKSEILDRRIHLDKR
jgi:hypothetical protein